jgi:transcriptional regulator with XRE-family HTH domain
VNVTASLNSVPAGTEAGPFASPPGIVAGTVLRAARLSAHLTQAQFAEVTGVDEANVAAWEDGHEPLAGVPYPVFGRIESVLAVSAEPGLAADLTVAVWCDLVVTAIAGGQDITCLMADPTAAEPAFGELLTWSAGGQRPARYRPYAGPGPLLQPVHAGLIAGTIMKLSREWPLLGLNAA